MGKFVVKVTMPCGRLRLPVVANFATEEQAVEAVRLMVDDEDNVEARPLRDDVMEAAFGNMPEGVATFRPDWFWSGENDDTPEPY